MARLSFASYCFSSCVRRSSSSPEQTMLRAKLNMAGAHGESVTGFSHEPKSSSIVELLGAISSCAWLCPGAGCSWKVTERFSSDSPSAKSGIDRAVWRGAESVVSPLCQRSGKSRTWGSTRGHTWFRASVLKNRLLLCLLLICSRGLGQVVTLPFGRSNLNGSEAFLLTRELLQDLYEYVVV